MPTNAIPAHPGVAAAMAAATGTQRPAPVPTHQPNRTIPAHPTIMAQQARASMSPAPTPAESSAVTADSFFAETSEPHPQQAFFEAAADGGDVGVVAPQESPPEAPVSPQPTYSDIDALLEDLPQGAEPAQPPPVVREEAPSPPPPPAAAAAPFDAAAAQKAAIDQLMGREYALDENDQRRLISEPEAVIPRLAAQVHVNVVQDVGRRVGEVLPALVQRYVSQMLEGQRAEMEFFGRYPKLANPAFRQTVTEAMRTVTQMNPGIDRDSLMRKSATLSAFMIRSQYASGAPPNGGPQTRAPIAPYRPVPGGGGPPVPTRPQEPNPWADLAQDADLFNW
jgi:hypothetical protein